MRSLVVLFTFVAISGCSGDDDLALIIDLRTDYIPGIKFSAVETRLEERDAAASSPALRSDTFIDRRRVAAFDSLGPGLRTIVVRLLDADGQPVATRRVVREQQENASVLVVIGRACEGLTCPSAGDVADATECRGGACVTPECEDETGAGCALACTDASDCPEADACSTRRCEVGACLYRADDSICAAGEYCDPSRGCRVDPSPPVDGGADSGVVDGGVSDSSFDGGPDARSDSAADANVDTGMPDAGACGVSGDAVALFRASAVPPGIVTSVSDLAPSGPDLSLVPIGTGVVVANGTTLVFDGSTVVERTGSPSEALFDRVVARGEVSFEVWVEDDGMWGQSIAGLGGAFGFRRENPDVAVFEIGETGMMVGGIFVDSEPHHLVGTYDGTAAGQLFFIDDVEVTVPAMASTAGFSDWTRRWTALKLGGGPDGFHVGEMYLAAVYERVLTPIEISCLFAAGPMR